jgi:hypothetical protein
MLILFNIKLIINLYFYLLHLMEELQALQKKLIDMQKSGGGFKLSERTMVDIIQKVVNRKKVKLIYTTSGKEYVAEEKITKEISDEVKRNQGLVSKIELVKALEVPPVVIDNKVKDLLTKDKSLNLIEGKIITNYYLDNMCNEINEILKNNGSAFISDLATKFDFSMDFMKKILKERTGSSIKGKLYATRLLTDDFIETQKQRIRPILIGSTTPVTLSYMIENFGIDDMIIEDLVKNLLDSGVVRGKYSANVFEPSIFSESQASYVKGVLAQNNYIEYSKLKNIGISKNAKEYIKEIQKKEKLFQDGLFLTEFFVSPNLKNNFEYIFFDNYSKNNSTNLSSIFLFELYNEDINTLLDSINVNPNTVYLINMNLIPISLIENFIQEISPKLKEEASKQYNSFITKSKEKEKKKLENEKENSSANTKDKKGKQKGKQKGGKNKQEDEDEEESTENYIQLTPGFKKEIQAMIFKSPNLEEMNDKEDSVSELFEKYVLQKINQLYAQYINEFIKSKSQSPNDPKNLMSQIENEYFELKVVQKSVENLLKMSTETNFQSAVKAIIAHICKKDLGNLFKNVLTYQLIHMKLKIDLNQLNDPNQRKDIIKQFPDEDLKEIFSSLSDSLQNKNFISFMNTLQDNSKFLAISLSQLDKKREKVMFEKYNSDLLNLVDQKFNLLGKTSKKDYISLAVDMCHTALLKKGIYLRLPYEQWALGIFQNISIDSNSQAMKIILIKLIELLNLSEDELYNKQEELIEYFKKLLNTY